MAIVKKVLPFAVGIFLLVFGGLKFGGAHIFQFMEYNATRMGLPLADLLYPVANYATGLLEIAAGVLVMLPQTRVRIGAPLAVLPFLGAFLFHLSPLLGVTTPDGFNTEAVDGVIPLEQALAQGSGFAREHFVPLQPSAESPVLFILAVVFLGVAVANFVLTRGDA